MKRNIKKLIRRAGGVANADIARDVETLRVEVDKVRALAQNVVDRQSNTGTIQIGPNEIITKIFTGIKIFLDTRDISVTPHLALDGIYEGHISNAWLSLIDSDSTVIDIGANFGYFGALAAQRTDKKKSKVILFEANPNLIPFIRKTFAVNWINEQSVIENIALSSKDGTATLHVFKDYIGSSSLHDAAFIDSFMHGKMHTETQEEVKVKTTTLDNYCKKNGIKTVDLIKMDIEGFEEEAYTGMQGVVKSSPNLTLFIEFTKQSYKDAKGFYERMLSDFGNVYTIDELGKLHKPKDTSYQSMINYSDDWVMPVFSKRSDLAE